MFFVRNTFYLATFFYLLSWGAAFRDRNRGGRPVLVLLTLGLLANLVSAAGRYYFSWPLMPIYQTPFFLPLLIGIFSFKSILSRQADRRTLLLILSFLSLAAAFFPNDFYLPFLKSRTIFAHLFFLTGLAARACFIIAGIRALEYLRLVRSGSAGQADPTGITATIDPAFRWIVWGFAWMTISVFAGESWSYIGWGSPVVWDDAAVLTAMGTWFYYACLLHLHLHRDWNTSRRAGAVLLGALLTMIFNLYPEMGSFQIPDPEHLFSIS
jgi:ABC-type transport system involved in cytochrome c biogenesis permease subunit